ncbi:MAG: ABC transporter substrate-binding protein [Synergistaceae bacterium]|jgi:NitT/TauT family transport system substrate-binding protein|nr:ABC transporter substrate-binding protein [Synergistaceae bacterium]
MFKRVANVYSILVLLAIGIITGASAEAASSLPKIRVGIIQEGAVRPALVVVAQSLGYYEEEGVDVEFVYIDGGGTAWTSIEAGNLDVYPYAVCTPLSVISQNGDFVIFAGTATEGSSVVVNDKVGDVDFSDYRNWAGKKIGVEVIAESETLPLIREDLKAIGVLDQVEFVVIDDAQARLEALRKGAIDAATLTEERVAIAKELGLKEAFPIGEKYPGYVCCRQTTSFKSLKEKRESYVKYLKAQIRAYRDYKLNTEVVVRSLAKFLKVEPEFVRNYIATPKDKTTNGEFVNFKNQVNPDPAFNKVERLYKGLLAEKVLVEEEGVKLKDHFNISIFKEALDDLLKEYPDDKVYKEVAANYALNNSDF